MPTKLMMPSGWDRPEHKRKAYDVVDAFTTKNGREPTPAELACLKKAVDKAKHGIALGRSGEWEYQHGWFAAQMTIERGRCLTAKEWDAGDAVDWSHFKGKPTSAAGKSRVLVGYYVSKWKHEHPSGFFHWLGKAVSSAVKVIAKVAPIAKLIPIVGQAVSAIELGVNAVQGISTVANAGKQLVAANKVLTAGKALLPPTDHTGFDVGAALMHDPKLTKEKILAVRKHLKPDEKRGFDTAVSIQTGMATADATVAHKKHTSKPPTSLTAKVTLPALDDTAKAAFYAGIGMQGAPPKLQKGMLTKIAANPQAKAGIVLAAAESQDKGFFQRVKEFFGFYDLQPLSKSAPATRAATMKKGPKAA